MNSNEIRKVLAQFVPEEFKTGVYASDQLKYVCGPLFAIIVNSDDSEHSGTHWLALIKSHRNSNIVEFFDSFALPIKFYGKYFNGFFTKNRYRIKVNNRQLQSTFSTVCGQYCLYYLACRLKGIPMNNIISEFSRTNLEKNDFKVETFVKLNYMTPLCVRLSPLEDHVHCHCTVQSCKKKCKLKICKKK